MYHKMFVDIIMDFSKHFTAIQYINYVLNLRTKILLQCDPTLGEEETTNMEKLRNDFEHHIGTFVQKPKLSQAVCSCIKDFVVCAACMHLCAYSSLIFYAKFIVYSNFSLR